MVRATLAGTGRRDRLQQLAVQIAPQDDTDREARESFWNSAQSRQNIKSHTAATAQTLRARARARRVATVQEEALTTTAVGNARPGAIALPPTARQVQFAAARSVLGTGLVRFIEVLTLYHHLTHKISQGAAGSTSATGSGTCAAGRWGQAGSKTDQCSGECAP